MESTSIYSNRCWYKDAFVPATVVLENGIITGIIHRKVEHALDAGDAVLMPGVIDAHVHVNEPGRTEWEGFETATKAAASGGITTIVDMPLNAHPVTTTAAAFRQKIASTQEKLYVNCGFYGGLVPGNSEQMQALAGMGVLGIKCFLTHSGIDEFPNVTLEELERAMPLLSQLGVKLLVHCELSLPQKQESGDPGNYMSYLHSRPDTWETNAILLMIRLCRKHNCAVHIVHVSSAESLNLIGAAKKEGLPISAETCAHYIYFNAEEIPDNKTIFKCAPPIRKRANNKLLRAALQNGLLDFITSDHSPAPPGIKEILSGNIMKAWGGISGLQFLLSASWTACRGEISLEKFIPLLTSGPASFLGLNKKGCLEVGYDADLVIWNPEQSFVVTEKDIEHRHKICPYVGEILFGEISQTIVNGQIVYNKNAKHTFVLAGNTIFRDTTIK